MTKGTMVGKWRCTYSSWYRYEFRLNIACVTVYQNLTDRVWVVWAEPGVPEESKAELLRACERAARARRPAELPGWLG